MFKGKVGLKVILRWSYFVGKQRQRLNLRLGMNSSSEQGGGETWAQYNSTRSFLNLSSKIWYGTSRFRSKYGEVSRKEAKHSLSRCGL